MYYNTYDILYLLMGFYIMSGIIFYNHIKPHNEHILLFLTLVYISYAFMLFNILNKTNNNI